VDADVMRLRAADARVARLATLAADGGPHLVPCCFALEGDRFYTAVDDIKAKSTLALRRLSNVVARPRVSVLVDHYAEEWESLWWVRMDGDAHVAEAGAHEHATAIELLSAKYHQYRLQPPPGAVTVVEIDRWRAWP
jgi:PPOX class probable F420-dependent enzyme